ncbi:MAG: AsmA-like C-terminal region-containing protein, partial [Pseudomonadota bacterium]
GRVPVQISLSEERGGAIYTVTGRDAGTALSALGIIQSVRNGDFRAEISQIDGRTSGNFQIERVRVRNASPVVALLDSISVVGLLQQLDGEGLVFQTVRGRFELEDKGVHVWDLSAVGASLGFTTRGYYQFSDKSLNLEGTVTPIYALNGVFERVFRKASGRERGEGLFSFVYRMKGPATDPSVRVNPLSILFPGVTREIWRSRMPRLPKD